MRLIVIKGNALIKTARAGVQKTQVFAIKENDPWYFDIPIWHTLTITNAGTENLRIIRKCIGPHDQTGFGIHSEKV